MRISFKNLVLSFVATLATLPAMAQINTIATNEQTQIDQSPFASPRASAMGGAINTIADDLDATFANPAGIGGLGMNHIKLPWVRKLYFPHVSASANENTKSLNSAFKEQGGADDSAIGQSILDASYGDRQFARANAVLGIVFGRTILVPFTDYQVAAVAQDNGLVDTHYRSMSGIGYGFSAQDANGIFSVGYFGYSAKIKDLDGQLNYSEFVDAAARKKAFSNYTNNYDALGHNVGLVWQLGKKASPRLSLAMTDIQDTKLVRKGEPKGLASPVTSNSEDSTSTAASESELASDKQQVFKQNTTLGFSISPQITNSSHLNWVLELTKIGENETSVAKKFRTGLEYNIFGGTGSYALFSLRAGYNNAGPSGGFLCNFGIINFEASSYAVDIGVDNSRVIERRITGSAGVNVGEF